MNLLRHQETPPRTAHALGALEAAAREARRFRGRGKGVARRYPVVVFLLVLVGVALALPALEWPRRLWIGVMIGAVTIVTFLPILGLLPILRRRTALPQNQRWHDAVASLRESLDRLERADLDTVLAAVQERHADVNSALTTLIEAWATPHLLALDDDEAQSLSPPAREWLRTSAACSDNASLRVAALLALGAAGDGEAVRLARSAQFAPDTRVSAAATEVLLRAGEGRT